MTISAVNVVGSSAVQTGTTTFARVAVPPIGVPSGSTIFVYTQSQGLSVTSVTDDAGNIYVKDANYITPQDSIFINVWRTGNSKGLTFNQLITARVDTETAVLTIAVESYRNIDPSSPLDVTAVSGGADVTSLVSGTTGRPVSMEELVVGIGEWSSNVTGTMTVTPGAAYSLNQTVQPPNGSTGLFSESKIVNAVSSASSSATLSGSSNWGQLCLVYRSAPLSSNPAGGQAQGTVGGMSTPTPGSTLPGSTVTFTWTVGTSSTAYDLFVGSTPAGLQYANIYIPSGASTTTTVTGLPTDSSVVYVRLWSFISGAWASTDYSYTASSAGGGNGQTPVTVGLSLPTLANLGLSHVHRI